MNDIRRAEVAQKVDRVARLAASLDLRGILIGLQPTFAWLTAGKTNRIDGSREQGAGALLITADGRRFVIANNIESPRLAAEAVAGHGFEVADFKWFEERADPGLPFATAVRVAGGPIGSDLMRQGIESVEPALAALRFPLTASEIDRYRALGADAARAMGHAMARVTPGGTETEAAGTIAAALASVGARPIVLLAAGDDRIARYRHPVPTSAPWTERLLVATCCERDGLIVALSRIVTTRASDDLTRRTRAAASACAAMLNATTNGVTGAPLFEAAASAYAAAGFPGEEAHHHQGGAIGYRAREWVAHPGSQDVVQLPQTFAWNPTVAGTKVEETCLVHEDGQVDVLTSSPAWPSIRVEVRGQQIDLPDVLRM